jgi:hypothetical protein
VKLNTEYDQAWWANTISHGFLAMVWLVMVIVFLLTGCINASMLCPDKVSNVSYKGLGLFGTTTVTCAEIPGGGNTVLVSGMDLMALAAMIAPMVAAKIPPPKVYVEPAPSSEAVPQSEPSPDTNL